MWIMTEDLFSSLPPHQQVCQDCFATGLVWRATSKQIGRCQKCRSYQFNPDLTGRTEVKLVWHWARIRSQIDGDLSPLRFDIAKILTCYSSADPCTGESLQGFVMSRGVHRVDAERYVKKSIETLRNTWLLPVASRKEKPSGYWVCRSQVELADWSQRNARPSITALATNHKVVKANTAIFGGQSTFDFMRFVNDELLAVEEAA